MTLCYVMLRGIHGGRGQGEPCVARSAVSATFFNTRPIQLNYFKVVLQYLRTYIVDSLPVERQRPGSAEAHACPLPLPNLLALVPGPKGPRERHAQKPTCTTQQRKTHTLLQHPESTLETQCTKSFMTVTSSARKDVPKHTGKERVTHAS